MGVCGKDDDDNDEVAQEYALLKTINKGIP